MSYKDLLHKRKIVKHLYFYKASPCSIISEVIDVSFPLAARMINELLAEGVIYESGFAPSTGGRKPVLYSIVKDAIYVMAVSLDQYYTRLCIMDMSNDPVTTVERFPLDLKQETDAVRVLQSRIEQVIEKSGIEKYKIIGIGIGMPGFVDAKRGVNYSFFRTGENVALAEMLTDQLGMHVFIDNDSRLVALAEYEFGGHQKCDNTLIINLGWGVGLGMVLDGEVFRGHQGFAGEFSHIPLFLNNKLCSCGKSGCLETEAALTVMISKAREGIENGSLTNLKELHTEDYEEAIKAIFSAAAHGDKFSLELLSATGYNIGRGIAVLIHLLNPGKIIISGIGALAGRVWQAPIQLAVNEHCIPRLAANTEIAISSMGPAAALIGAAALVMDNYDQLQSLSSLASSSNSFCL